MFKNLLGSLVMVGVVLVAFSDTCFAWGRAEVDAHCRANNATFSTSSQRCVCNSGYTESGGTCVQSGGSSGSSGGSYAGSSYDYEAERRAQEAAAAAAEEQRRREAELEKQRREDEERRLLEEAARQAKFLEDRDAAAAILRGSTGTSATSNTSGGTVLRGSSVDTGLRGLKSDTTQEPNLDPMVVDARNVPSGLPTSVDNAIPRTPAGDRVRKGFQAIQNGDWQVALAWFKDARNQEPGNPGLDRLVDLAEFTLDYRARPKTPAIKNFNQIPSAELSKQNSTNNSIDSAEAKSGTPAAESADAVADAAASQMAARARADAAFEQYVKKYGEGDVIGRASAVAKASRGEGYTSKELKAQLHKALLEYRNIYGKSHPNSPVGGSCTADEIKVGIKG